MLRTTLWRPDTCGCAVEFAWDDTADDASRDHAFTRSVACCQHHAPLSGIPEHLAEIQRENRIKNASLVMIAEAHPSAAVSWRFDAQRTLVVAVSGITQQEAGALASAIAAEFGSAVRVE